MICITLSTYMSSKLLLQRKTTAQFNTARYIKKEQSLSSEFDKHFIDFASVEPIATYKCFPFATDIDVENIVSKIRSFLQLDIAAVENEKLSLQNVIEMKSSISRMKIIKSIYRSVMTD